MSDATPPTSMPFTMHCRPQHEWLPETGAPQQLILLLHGEDSDAAAMAPLALALRAQFSQAAVLAPDAPQRADMSDDGGDTSRDSNHDHDAAGMPTGGGRGAGNGRIDNAASADHRQWYSTQGLTPENLPIRVAAALANLQRWVHVQQQRLGVSAAATCLGGFSQGAVMALALAQLEDGIAGRVLSFSGRFLAPPEAAPRDTTIHLFHGSADRIIPADGSRQALQWLGALRGDATLDIAEGVGHALHPVLIDCALQRLQTHIPLRTWQAALGAVPAPRGAAGTLDD